MSTQLVRYFDPIDCEFKITRVYVPPGLVSQQKMANQKGEKRCLYCRSAHKLEKCPNCGGNEHE